jgi:urea transport system ATP-binding protein
MEMVLYVDNVTVSFDGFKALDGLSLYLRPGELRAIIGPNGAGKTTLMDVITGRTRPDQGEVIFKGGVNLARQDEARTANLGVGRKFQQPTVFENQTVFANLELALAGKRGLWQSLGFRLEDGERRRIEEVLATIALEDLRHQPAGQLSHGQKQWLEIGMLLMQRPELMLLDEPVAGMTDAETEQTARLLRGLAGQHSVVVVEHDMDFVRSLECMVTVLHEGRVLTEGSMETVQNDHRVVEVYLGR